MRRTWVRLIPLLILLVVPGVARSQDQPEFKMPCPEVLKLGLNKFVDAYGEKTQDFSTYGQKQAFGYYVDCLRPHNDILSSKLPEARRRQVNTVRDQLKKLGEASWTNAYLDAGGGTMYGLASVGAYATREDFMTLLIRSLQNESPQPRARRRANASLVKVRRSMPTLASKPDLSHWDVESRPRHAKLYLENVKQMRSAVAVLVGLVRMLPDRAAEHLAAQIKDEISAGLEE